MTPCIINRNNKKDITQVNTRSGERSILYDKIASIPLMENRERALSVFKIVYSNKFMKLFGNWISNTPVNRKAYNIIKKNIDIVPEQYRNTVLDKTSKMDNPLMISRANPPYEIEEDGFSFYSTSVSKDSEIILVDAMNPSELVVKTDPGTDKKSFIEDSVSSDFTPVINIEDDGSQYIVVKNSVKTYTLDELSSSETENTAVGPTYLNGEPRLFFMNDKKELFENYGDALKSGGTEIRMGFLAGPAQEVTNDYVGDAGVVHTPSGYKLNNEKAFIPIMTASTSTSLSSIGGVINYLIKKGYLAGSKIFDPETGSYFLTGEGHSGEIRLFNSAVSYAHLRNLLGNRVYMNDRGMIRIRNVDEDNIMVRTSDGKTNKVSKEQIKNAVKAGRYNELDAKYDHFDALVLSLIMEDNNLYSPSTSASLISSYRTEEINQRNAIVEILKTLGVRVVGMSDYIDRYQIKYGIEPSAKALADIANGVIAVGEEATISDMVEEVSHFLVETYKDQDAISSVLDQVENTSEWDAYAGEYYAVYGNKYEGSELDNVVRREILGKILSSQLGSRINQAPDSSPAGFMASVRALISGIRSWLKSALTTQRSDLNSVIKNIRDLAITDMDKGFDTSLLKDNDFTLYSLSAMKKNQVLSSHINTLKRTLRDLRQISSDRAATTSMSLNQLKTIEDKINSTEDSISKNEMAASLNSMIATSEAQVRYLKGIVKDIVKNDRTDGKLHFNISDRQNAEIINNQVLPLLRGLRGFINNRSDDFTSSEKREYINRIDDVVAEINGIQSDIKSVEDIDEKNFLDKLMNELNIPSDKVEKIKNFFNKVQKDVSWISRWFGILEHSSSVYNNALGALLAKDNYNAMANTQSKIASFMADVKKNGWNVSKFDKLLQTVDGRTSSYLRSALNYAKFEQDYKTEQMRALREVLGLNDLTDEMIKDIVENNKSYLFKKEIIDENGKTILDNVRFKPSIDRVNVDIFSVAEEKKFSDIMGNWIEEHTEQPFLESYKKKLEEVYSDAEAELGHPVSEKTKEYLNALSRQKYVLRRPFIDENGNFDFIAYSSSSNYEEVGLLQKQKKEAASEYIYIGSRRVPKEGEQLEMAKEIQAINRAWTNRLGKSEINKVTNKFLSDIRELQSSSNLNGKNGGDIAFRYLMHGGHFSFSEAFWEKIGYGQSSRTESNNNANFNKMADDIKRSTIDLEDDVDFIVEEINRDREIIKEIINNNRDVSNIGEINQATFTDSEMDAFREASERIEANYAALIDMAKMAGLEVDEYLNRSTDIENEVNQSYWDALADSNEPEWQFASRHTTAKKAKRISDFRRKIIAGVNNRYTFTISETNFLSEITGIDKNLDKRAFRNKVNAFIEVNTTNHTRPEWIVDQFARRMVFSYYKRMAPSGYTDMLNKIHEGKIDVAKMVEDLQNGKSTQDYGMDLSYLRFEPNRSWTEENISENAGRNPNYVKDHGYGRYMPKITEYADESYINDFGIKYDDSGNEVATKNVAEWKMINMLKGMMKESLSLYKEQNRNIYSIPQISKSDIEKLSNLGTSPVSTLRNFVSDLCLDRVDDSLYGNTQIGENRDPEDRPRNIPKYYINELDNQDDVAHDLAYSYSMLMMQASLYDQKQNTIELAMGLEQMLLNKQFANGKKVEATQAYHMFKDFFNAHYYGIRMNTKKLTVNIGGYTVDLTRIMMAFERFMSTMNLALSPFVAATGAITGHMNLMMESAIGQYISKDSLRFASAEFSRLAPSYISEVGDIDRKSKLYVIGERMGIFNINDRIFGAGYNRVARTLLKSPMYSMMEIMNSPLNPQVMIATMDNVRFYNGRFYTFQDFKREKENKKESSTIRRDWDSLKNRTLWSMIDVEDGNIKVKPGQGITEEMVETQLQITRNQVRSLAQICNGSLNEENRTAATRNWMARFMTAHRGWLVLAAQRLWKSRGFNFQTMQEEEGLCITLKNLIGRTFKIASEKEISNFLEAWDKNKSDMDEVEKTNIKRLAIYGGTFLILEALSILLSGWRDDDDREENWLTQFGTYVGFRSINEIASQMPFIMELNVVDIINDPFVMGRKLKDLTDFRNYSLNKVTSGAYEGDTKLFRTLSKMTFIKQWYNIKTPEDIARASRWWQQTNNKSMMFFIGARPESEGDDDVSFK